MANIQTISKETLVFYGNQRQEQYFRAMFPELFEMYDVQIKILESWARKWPKAIVGDLEGKGWRKIFFRFA